MSVGPFTRAAVNVLAGWMGLPVPAMPKQRNSTRAGHRKTDRRRHVRDVSSAGEVSTRKREDRAA